jgi:hypothetical protein|tara:strand:+ start:1626 stop:1817 length:192 start_codon:yes stop_codon:yes gene_type:complete
MCLICTELKKEKLTALEARKNLDEMHSTMNKNHILEVLKLIWDKEDEEYSYWYEKNHNCGDTD